MSEFLQLESGVVSGDFGAGEHSGLVIGKGGGVMKGKIGGRLLKAGNRITLPFRDRARRQ